jgi:hypothetical protein
MAAPAYPLPTPRLLLAPDFEMLSRLAASTPIPRGRVRLPCSIVQAGVLELANVKSGNERHTPRVEAV